MTRLPLRDADALDPGDRDLLRRPIHLYRAMVNAPGMTRAFQGWADHVRFGGRLDPRLRELAILQVAWTTRSAYEWSHHVRIGRAFGVTDADLRAVMREEGTPDAAGGAVLRAARGIAAAGDLSDAEDAGLRDHLDDAARTELLLIASLYVGLSRFLTAARIGVEEEYEAELRDFPLPPA